MLCHLQRHGVRAIDRICTDEALAAAEELNLQALTRIGQIIDEYQLPAHTVGFGAACTVLPN